jgi:hypothetical protein
MDCLIQLKDILIETANSYSDTGLSVSESTIKLERGLGDQMDEYKEKIIKILLETATEYNDVGFHVDYKRRIISLNEDRDKHQLIFQIGQNSIELQII